MEMCQEKKSFNSTENGSLLLYLKMICCKNLYFRFFILTDRIEKLTFFCPKDAEVSNSFQARALRNDRMVSVGRDLGVQVVPSSTVLQHFSKNTAL